MLEYGSFIPDKGVITADLWWCSADAVITAVTQSHTKLHSKNSLLMILLFVVKGETYKTRLKYKDPWSIVYTPHFGIEKHAQHLRCCCSAPDSAFKTRISTLIPWKSQFWCRCVRKQSAGNVNVKFGENSAHLLIIYVLIIYPEEKRQRKKR